LGRALARNCSFGFLCVGFKRWQKPNVQFVRWCERRTPTILVGADYSIGISLFILL